MATGRFGSPAKNMNKGYGPAKTSSPAKQTAKQKASLPPKVVDAIAAKQGKSPAKQMSQLKTKSPAKKNVPSTTLKNGDMPANSNDGTRGLLLEGGSNTGPNPYKKAAKKDPKLADYVKARKTLKKGSAEWNANQNKINAAYGVTKRYKVEATPKTEPKAEVVEKKMTKTVTEATKVPAAKSQRLKAKEAKASADGKTRKAERLSRRANRVEAREENKASRVAARAARKSERDNKKTVKNTAKKVAKKTVDSGTEFKRKKVGLNMFNK